MSGSAMMLRHAAANLSGATVRDQHHQPDSLKRKISSSTGESSGAEKHKKAFRSSDADQPPSAGSSVVGPKPSGKCLLIPDKSLEWGPSQMSRRDCLPPGWTIGAKFELKHNTHHRVYEGPPDGTPRVRLGPDEIYVDFDRVYQVTEMYANSLFTAVSFKVPDLDDAKTSNPDGNEENVYEIKPPGSPPTIVWTNVRRKEVWWAKLVDEHADCRNDESEIQDNFRPQMGSSSCGVRVVGTPDA